MVWQDGPLAITEDYYWTSASDDAVKTVTPAALALYKLRSLMMGSSVVPISIRLSVLGSFRTYLNVDPAQIQGVQVGPLTVQTNPTAALQALGVGKTADGDQDQAKQAVLANFTSTLAQHGRKFLAGVPDVMTRENPEGPWIVGVPSWGTAFNNWGNQLTSNTQKWAFKSRTAPTVAPWKPVAVAQLLLDPTTGFWGVDCPTFVAPIAVGQVLQIRGFKMTSKAYVPVQGTLQIASIVASTIPGNSVYYLRGSQTWAGTQVAVFGTAQGVDFSLYPFVTVTPGKETTHKRGNRSLASPGRLKKPQRVSA